jgi:hypothetical protein
VSKLQSTAIFVAAASVTSLLFLDFCNWIFACGCRSLWAGADAHCNIHHVGAKHCPFCSIGNAGAGAVFIGILIPQAFFSFRPVRWAWHSRFLAALAAFPLAGSAIAFSLGWYMGYWN